MDLKKTLMTLVIFLFLLSSAFGAEKDRDMFLYKDIEVLLTIDNRITVDTFSQDSYIDFVSANLSWFPRNDYRQRIETFTTTPKAEKKQNLEFLWERPSDNVFDLKLEAKLISKNEFVPVGKKVPFPVRNIGYEYKEYLQAGQIADLNTDIARLASELSEGEDDMYVVVFTLADWVK
ncbi:MAG: hypothetical protein KKG59_02375 [Nanoarchaeota archaeon]|nr:hypothetical protein [Nanoarchaeota archaeon]